LNFQTKIIASILVVVGYYFERFYILLVFPKYDVAE
jgi:CTP:phosphocholine cytidylyltransferase-like protein